MAAQEVPFERKCPAQSGKTLLHTNLVFIDIHVLA